jgi:hypothetical protein
MTDPPDDPREPSGMSQVMLRAMDDWKKTLRICLMILCRYVPPAMLVWLTVRGR